MVKYPDTVQKRFINLIFLENILRTIMKIISELSDNSQDRRARYKIACSKDFRGVLCQRRNDIRESLARPRVFQETNLTYRHQNVKPNFLKDNIYKIE